MDARSEERLSVLLPTASIETLEALYDQCAADFCDICNREDVPERASSVLEQMIVYRYNLMGQEGTASASMSGISESYLEDYPEALKKAMYRYRKLVAL